MTDRLPVSIIGIGNTERMDDSIGVLAVEGLREERARGEWDGAGREVEIVPAGPDSLLAAAHAADGRWVIIVDAARMGLSPGDSRIMDVAEAVGAPRGGLAPHAADLAETLALLDVLGCSRRVRVIGIEAEDVGEGRGLSPRLRARLPEVRARIKEEVGRLP